MVFQKVNPHCGTCNRIHSPQVGRKPKDGTQSFSKSSHEVTLASEIPMGMKNKTANIYIDIKLFKWLILTYNQITTNWSCSNKNQDQKVTTTLDVQCFPIFVSVSDIALGSGFFALLAFTMLNRIEFICNTIEIIPLCPI